MMKTLAELHGMLKTAMKKSNHMIMVHKEEEVLDAS
jgi:hypothetical protein